jgi:hypothetical protein
MKIESESSLSEKNLLVLIGGRVGEGDVRIVALMGKLCVIESGTASLFLGFYRGVIDPSIYRQLWPALSSVPCCTIEYMHTCFCCYVEMTKFFIPSVIFPVLNRNSKKQMVGMEVHVIYTHRRQLFC